MRIFRFSYFSGIDLFKRRLKLAGVLFLSLFLTIGVYSEMQKKSIPSTAEHVYPIYRVTTEEKIAALTFDISWGNKIAAPVLEILKEKNVRATFFLSGPWAEDNIEIPKRIAIEGHEIASHGHRHIDYDQLSPDVIKQEMTKAQDILQAATGQRPILIRTPNGAYNDQAINTIHALDYEAIQWSVDSLDWTKPGVEAIISRVTEKIHPGAIVLMHASDSCPDTPEALPVVIDRLQKQGYKLVTVSELLEYGPGTI